MKVNCIVCSREDDFDEKDCVFGLVTLEGCPTSSKAQKVSLSGTWQDKPYVCLRCFANSEKECETSILFAARVKAAKESISPHDRDCCKFDGNFPKERCVCDCHNIPFEFAVVIVKTKKDKFTKIFKTLKNEDLSRFETIFGVYPSLQKAEKKFKDVENGKKYV